MADKTIGEIVKQLELGESSENLQKPALSQIDLGSVIKASLPDQAQNKGDSIVIAVKSTTGNLTRGLDLTTKSQIVEAGGMAESGSRISVTPKITQVNSDPPVNAVKDYFVPSKQSTSSIAPSIKSTEASNDHSDVLNKMDEIKEVLESNQKKEQLVKRQSKKLYRPTKRSGSKESGGGLLDKVFSKRLRQALRFLPKLRTALSDSESVFAGVAGPVADMKENTKEKAVQINKAEREAQLANVLANKARKARKNEDGFDYVDSWMKKKPAATIADDRIKALQSEPIIKKNRELIKSKSVTATKAQRELTSAFKPTIKKKDDVAAQAKAVIMQKMTAQVQGSDAKKQLDALIAEFKGMRKDIKKQSNTPREVQNPMLRETIIQSKNLFK